VTTGTDEAAAAFASLAADKAIVVCCGSGGVGKTTVSAAFAMEAAQRGRRACVVTIDPARRLANALGVDELTNVASPIEGPWTGELHALMLDSKGTFDDLVRKHAATDEQAEGILANRLYKNLSGALSGTQEYMAMEKLYELVEESRYDVVVVDTPPSRNALDFLEAPGRLTKFLGHRLFQLLLTPTRAYLRAVSVAMQTLMRTLSRVAGADIVQDAITFFQAFEGMEEGFRVRADHVRDLLGRSSTAFVLVTAPRDDTVDEARWFADRLQESGLGVDGLVVNRVFPAFAATPGLAPAPAGSALAALEANLRGYQALNGREEATFADLVRRLAPAPVVRVPLLDIDVHDVDGLGTMAGHLFGPRTSPGADPSSRPTLDAG
jgi:anion-transporting  ArsA/GET3 family ATPase